MERKYSIGIFAAAIVIVALLSFAYQAEYHYDQEQMQKESELKAVKKEEEEGFVTTQGDAIKKEIYFLKELNGYVVVYLSDQKTVFEYTNIPISELPNELAEEIHNGKVIDGTEKLYGFLENYSS
ncbi:hypothetical protein ABXS75_11455 [Roseburia hominis]